MPLSARRLLAVSVFSACAVAAQMPNARTSGQLLSRLGALGISLSLDIYIE